MILSRSRKPFGNISSSSPESSTDWVQCTFWAMLLSSIILSTVIVRANHLCREVKNNLLSRATTAAALIDPAILSNLEEAFSLLLRPCSNRVASPNQTRPSLTAAYIVSLDSQRIRFISGASAQPGSSNTLPNPGDVIGRASPEEVALIFAGHPIVRGPYPSGRSKSVTACAPVIDTRTGTVVAALALEVDAADCPKPLAKGWSVIAFALALTGTLGIALPRMHAENEATEQLRTASHDQLTGLANRSALISEIERAIREAGTDLQSTLLLIDIDDFRTLNDTLSYGVGDDVLVQVAQHIRDEVRKEDFVARFGEDAFAVLVRTPAIEQAVVTAERIRASLEHVEVETGGTAITVYLTVSVGIAEIDANSSVKDVALRADSALCAAKSAGKNRIVCSSVAAGGRDEPDAYTQIAMIEDALEHDKFILHFQPIVPIVPINPNRGSKNHFADQDHALKWVGYMDGSRLHEALVRIEGPNGEIIPPGKFIPWAEAIGLVAQIDLWVLEHAIEVLNERPDMNVAINLSARSISRPSFLTQVEQRVASSGLAPGRLGFEITETAGLGNFKEVRNWMRRMKALGCSFAIDDFGSGHTSMSYLSDLPVDIVKITGTIVTSMVGNPSHGLVVEAINSVVHVVGAWTVAESVENEEALLELKNMGIDFAQGFYFAPPTDLADIPESILAQLGFRIVR
ncbi:MAG: putative bifunctional diguanylate cyclase/phosphodiesterase [Bacillota bacterium]